MYINFNIFYLENFNTTSDNNSTIFRYRFAYPNIYPHQTTIIFNRTAYKFYKYRIWRSYTSTNIPNMDIPSKS